MFEKSVAPGHRKVLHQGTDKEQIVFISMNKMCNSESTLPFSLTTMTTPEVVNWRKTPACLQLGQYEGKLMNGNGLACRRKKANQFRFLIT